MTKYRKKPIIVEAFRFGFDNYPEWFMEKVWEDDIEINRQMNMMMEMEEWCDIWTEEGDITASYGDWIIKGIDGEIYPCKHRIFEKTYEEVPE